MDATAQWGICLLTFVSVVLKDVIESATPPSLKAYDIKPAFRYGVMMDVGSSSTKLRLYRWPKRLEPTDLPELEDFYYKKFKPSLTIYSGEPERIPGYLQPIIERAKTEIPEGLHEETPIYAIATAGMRTLNSTWSRGVFDVVRTHLSNKTLCPFKFYARQARISSGEEEGVFAWISVNYLKGAFSKEITSPYDFSGVLEMGGGSTQITFFPDGPIYAGKFPVQIAGKIYPLYTHSYLMYGQNFISLRINNHLVKQSPGRSTVYNPCMLKGDTKHYQNVDILGSGDWINCERVLSNFLRTANDDWCFPKPCAIGRTYQPSVAGIQFYAIAGFVYSPKDLGLGPELVPARLREKAISYCNKTLKEAMASGVRDGFASTLCLMGLYIPKILTDAYDFPTGTTAITASNSIGDNKIAWTMGAMLYEIERLEFADEDDPIVELAPVCHTSGGHRTNLHDPVFLTVVVAAIMLVTFGN